MSKNHWMWNLRREIAGKDAKIEALENALRDLKNYVYSPKFDKNPYVNKEDIALRCEQSLGYCDEIQRQAEIDYRSPEEL